MGERADVSETLARSQAYCQELTRRAAKNFHFSFLTLSADRYRAMCALYAYLRVCDDLGDNSERTIAERTSDLAAWRNVVECGLAPDATTEAIAAHPCLPALRNMADQYKLPHQYLLDAITGMEMDLTIHRFATFADLEKYIYHVAGVVGLSCIWIWGYRDASAEPLAVDCGLALQLTNILRDVEEDWRLGRVYLPQEDLQRFGYDEAAIDRGDYNDGFRSLMEFEANRAAHYYQRAEELFEYLDPPGRPILRAMLSIYGGILKEIVRRRYAVYGKRVSLPTWKKLACAAHALVWQR